MSALLARIQGPSNVHIPKKVVKCCFILQLTQGQEHPLSHFITNRIKSMGKALISDICQYLMIFVDLWSHEASWRGQSQAGTELHSAAVGRTCEVATLHGR